MRVCGESIPWPDILFFFRYLSSRVKIGDLFKIKPFIILSTKYILVSDEIRTYSKTNDKTGVYGEAKPGVVTCMAWVLYQGAATALQTTIASFVEER